MRILHVIHSANPKGGGPIEGIKQLAGALLSQYPDSEVEVLSIDAPSDPWIAEFPLKIFPLGPGVTKYGWTPKLLPWLQENLAHYDVVIVNGIWQYTGYAVWRTLRHSTMPYCVFTHGMLDPWFKRRYPLKHLKKLLYWLCIEYWVLRRADAVFFTAEEEQTQARKSFRFYKAREVVVNYGTAGVEGDPASQRALFLQRFPELAGKRMILFLGRLHEKKGCELLLHAFQQLLSEKPETDLWLVMAGPYDNVFGERLKELATELGIMERIVWTGMLSGDLKWGAFHAAEAFALPSHQENFGIAVAEALSCGVPVLISDKVNIWREIDQDGGGLVETDDLAGTLRLLKRWEAIDPAERQAMGARARDCFAGRFQIAKAARGLYEQLFAVVGKRGPN